jgi:hypothetical protein
VCYISYTSITITFLAPDLLAKQLNHYINTRVSCPDLLASAEKAERIGTTIGNIMSGNDEMQQSAEGGSRSLFGWLVADCWCWFVLREEYC